jgi:Polysaccharide lyase family 4, domain II
MKTRLTATAMAAALVGLASLANAASYKEVEVSDGATITGTLSAGSAEAETKTFTISKDPGICGEGTRDVNFVRINDGMLQDAVVFLEKVKEGKAFAPETASLTLTQKGCEFSPFLGVMANKGDLTAINSDATLHNIHTYELIGKARRTAMNVSQPNEGDVVTKQVKLRKGNGLKVECDAHDFMHSFVFVARNPYYSVVDENGGFSIDGVPPGTYNIVAWHGTLGEIDGGEVVVSAGGEASVALSY